MKQSALSNMLRGPMGTLSSKRGYMFWMVVLFTITVILAYFGLSLPENIQTDIYWLTIAGVTAIVGERVVDGVASRPGRTEVINKQTIQNAENVTQEGA